MLFVLVRVVVLYDVVDLVRAVIHHLFLIFLVGRCFLFEPSSFLGDLIQFPSPWII